jgi:hypothetical protein
VDDDREHDRPAEVPREATSRPIAGRSPEGTLATALLAYAAVNGLSGLLIAFFPRAFWDTIGGAADIYDRAYGSTRFAGAALLALAVGALLVLRRPAGQQTLVTVFALEATFVTLAIFTTLVADDAPTDIWFEILMLLGAGAVAGYLWWARFKARNILKAR